MNPAAAAVEAAVTEAAEVQDITPAEAATATEAAGGGADNKKAPT